MKSAHGAAAAYLGGGSDLMVHKPEQIEVMIDIRHAGMSEVGRVDGTAVIGGGALLRDAEAGLADVAGGMLAEALRDTAPWLIRNAATVSGNIANASPAADSVPALMALDARLRLQDAQEEEVGVEEILQGPHQTTLGDRLIREIRIAGDAAARAGAFIKLARSKSDLAIVNVAVALSLDGGVARNVRIALGAVAPTAFRATQAEAALEGQVVTPERLSEVETLVRQAVRPIDDWRASAAYRQRMSGVIARRALQRALDSARTGDKA